VPRFFFHLYDDIVSLDPEGKEFPTLDDARQHAIKAARELACAEVLHGHLGLNHRIEIVDRTDAPVATVTFKEVVKLHP
jgi:hypothetical protein